MVRKEDKLELKNYLFKKIFQKYIIYKVYKVLFLTKKI